MPLGFKAHYGNVLSAQVFAMGGEGGKLIFELLRLSGGARCGWLKEVRELGDADEEEYRGGDGGWVPYPDEFQWVIGFWRAREAADGDETTGGADDDEGDGGPAAGEPEACGGGVAKCEGGDSADGKSDGEEEDTDENGGSECDEFIGAIGTHKEGTYGEGPD
jgi:hypothetical protein